MCRVNISVCSENQSKHKNTLYELNIEFVSVKCGRAWSNYWVLKPKGTFLFLGYDETVCRTYRPSTPRMTDELTWSIDGMVTDRGKWSVWWKKILPACHLSALTPTWIYMGTNGLPPLTAWDTEGRPHFDDIWSMVRLGWD